MHQGRQRSAKKCRPSTVTGAILHRFPLFPRFYKLYLWLPKQAAHAPQPHLSATKNPESLTGTLALTQAHLHLWTTVLPGQCDHQSSSESVAHREAKSHSPSPANPSSSELHPKLQAEPIHALLRTHESCNAHVRLQISCAAKQTREN